MTEEEFFDKENGTTTALLGPAMSDTDRNIMRDLAGEADEPCVFCDEPVRPNPNPHGSYWEFTAGEQPCHEECYDDAKEAAEEARAEDRADRRHADQEDAFNMRWPV